MGSDCGGGESATIEYQNKKGLRIPVHGFFLKCHILNVGQSIECLREKKPYQMSHLEKCGHLAERIAVTGQMRIGIACFGLPGLWMAALSAKNKIVDHQKYIF